MTTKELVECTTDDCAVPLGWIQALLTAADGSGWVNLEPIIPDEELAKFQNRRGVSGWFSARGSDLPFVTFMAPDNTGRRPQRASLGVQHGAGPKAVETLRSSGLETPSTWGVVQEHTKRGLIYDLPNDVDADAVLQFAFAVAGVLAPHSLDRWWSAVQYTST